MFHLSYKNVISPPIRMEKKMNNCFIEKKKRTLWCPCVLIRNNFIKSKKKCWGETYLNSGFAEADPFGQIFADESVRVMGPLEDLLQRRQLGAGERRPVAARLLATPAGRHVGRRRVTLVGVVVVVVVVGHERRRRRRR